MADTTTLPPDIAAQNKGPAILAAVITISILSTLFVAARLFVRAKILGKMHLDDYLIIVSVVFGWLAVGFAITAVSYGNGRHFAMLDTQQKSGAILWTIIGFCPGVMSFGVPKLAVVALLTRIMNPSPAHSIFLWCLTSICMLNLLSCVVILFAQCTPSRSQWDLSVKGKCISPWVLVHFAIYAGSFAAFVDLYLAVYPAIVLAKLQLNIKKKIALSGALGIGSIATVVAIYKSTRLPSLASPDFSYDTSDLVVWTVVEGSTIIIASCIPILQPLIDLIFGKRALAGTSTDRRYYRNYGSNPSGHLKSDIEMSNGRRSKKTRNPDKAITYPDTINDPTTGSQETILRQGQGGTSVVTKQYSGSGIIRTDDITVSYNDNLEPGKNDIDSRWS